MFGCFFPRPQLFLLAAALWALAAILFWYLVAGDWGDPTGLHEAIGAESRTVWLYLYVVACYAIFAMAWMRLFPHEWSLWSVGGSCLILFVTWFQVQLDVMINEWFGTFYDTVQKALAEPGAVTAEDYFGQLATFLYIAMVFITTAVLNAFFTSHYVFRWRTAMNDRYVHLWRRISHIEGASQRVQEDTMRFASIMESLGSRFIDAVMTLIAFLPILWMLSESVREIPVLGDVPGALVWVALIWSIGGTVLLAIAGYRLPGLEFRNQRVEAAFRKELVIGEDRKDRAEPITLGELFSNVRRNYFRLYLNYLYFNIFRYGYLQAGVILPYIALGPTIASAVSTLGAMQQILRALARVENSCQFLVNSWTTIVERISIYKRLRAFEAAIAGDEQAAIEFEVPGMRPWTGE